jgi:hypothetical protein
VDVSVEVRVRVDVSVDVDVVWVEEVRVGNVRVALGVGPSDGSDGSDVRDGAGIEIVRDASGRLLPPLHAASTTASVAAPRINLTVPRCITSDPSVVGEPGPSPHRTAVSGWRRDSWHPYPRARGWSSTIPTPVGAFP